VVQARVVENRCVNSRYAPIRESLKYEGHGRTKAITWKETSDFLDRSRIGLQEWNQLHVDSNIQEPEMRDVDEGESGDYFVQVAR
jgi:hypothetical protein